MNYKKFRMNTSKLPPELVEEFEKYSFIEDVSEARTCAQIAVDYAGSDIRKILTGLLVDIELDLHDAEFRPEDYHKYAGLNIAKCKIEQLLKKHEEFIEVNEANNPYK